MLTKHSGLLVFTVVVLTYCPTLAAQGPIPLRIPPPVVEREDEQEPVEESAKPTETNKQSIEDRASPYAAAGWCSIRKSGENGASALSSDGDGGDGSDDGGDGYCDMGIGFAIYGWKNFYLVGVVGSKSAGPGIAYKIPTPEGAPVLAVAIGLLFRYDSEGGIGRNLRPGLGITLTFDREGD